MTADNSAAVARAVAVALARRRRRAAQARTLADAHAARGDTDTAERLRRLADLLDRIAQ